MSFNKRASLEISIQAIVIVVLAMTILGLGLGFVRGLFKDIGGTTTQVTEQVKQKILDDLITGDKKVSFPATEVQLEKGGSTVISVGIRNKNNQVLKYQVTFIAVTDQNGNVFNPFTPTPWFQLPPLAQQNYQLDSAEADIRNIRVSIPTSVSTGSYLLTFEVIDTMKSPPDNIYAQKDFFIVVK